MLLPTLEAFERALTCIVEPRASPRGEFERCLPRASERARAAAMSEDTGGCVMFVDPKGTYSIVCNGVDDLFDV